MQTSVKYIRTETIEEEISPARINIKFTSIEFIMPNGAIRKASVAIGQDNYAIIENGKLRFKKELDLL
ncbi:hypothetical protein [Telluribacter sp.]|uniref:hypothetical protein n=1 Tax=Telluribacter sp. TaxID=1978767 RepID=UPI002E0FF7B9|nr:hypothetical protein [Telluribacter sp.]